MPNAAKPHQNDPYWQAWKQVREVYGTDPNLFRAFSLGWAAGRKTEKEKQGAKQ